MAALDKSEILKLVKEQQAGYSLKRPFYQDEAIYQAELERIFFQHWIYAGHSSEVANVGDYKTFEIDTESIIIVRSDKQTIKAHVNICRHRGSKLCLTNRGSKKRLVCPYHAWSYKLDGELIAARNMPQDFDPATHGLHSVQLEMLGGFIFVCLKKTPPSFKLLRNELQAITELFGFDHLKLAEQRAYSIPANWKLAVENYQECYHCAPSHQEFARIHAMAQEPDAFQAAKQAYWQQHQDNPKFVAHNYYFNLAEPGHECYQYDRNPLNANALSGSLDGQALAPLLGHLKSYDGGASELMVGPLSYFLLYDDHVLAYRFMPAGQFDCVCEVSWFVAESAIEGQDYQLDKLIALWDITTQADKKIIGDNQKGVHSRFYQSGRLSKGEAFQQSFLNWYLKAMAG